MKKIIYVVSTLGQSGPTNQLYNIIKNLDKNRFEAYLLTLSSEPTDSLIGKFVLLGIKVRSLSLSRLKGVFFAKAKLRRIIGKIKPCLVHTQGLRSDKIISSINFDIPHVCTVRNLPQIDYPLKYGRFLGWLMFKSHVKAMHKIKLCVGVSETVSQNLTDNFDISHTKTVLNGVDTETYFYSGEKKFSIREKLKLPSGKIWVYSGALIERKKPVLLIDAFQKTFGSSSENKLLFIGDGPLLDSCRVIAKDSSNIVFCGKVSNVSEYLQCSDYFVSCSKSEGLPNAVLEAMACGLPVLLSDIDPHKEIFQSCSEVGFLVKTDSLKSLIDGMKKIQRADYEMMSKAAVNSVLDNFSAKKMSEKYQEIYEQMC